MAEKPQGQAPVLRAERVLPQVARLLRPLISLLIRSGVTFPALAELLRELYVSVADKEFALVQKAQTDSRVSLLTGVHRKEVRRLREAALPATGASPALSRSSQIVARWSTAAPYLDADGRPKPLPRVDDGEGGASFESLVESVTRDVRPRAVLDDWLDKGIVEIHPPGLVALREAALVPGPGDDDQLYYFGRNLHDHVAAAVANVRGEHPPFFERAVHYDHLSEGAAERLASEAKDAAMDILLTVNKSAMGVADATPLGDWRWTLGVFVFREKVEPPKDGA